MTEITIIQVFQFPLLCSITGPDLKQYYSWTKKFFFSHPNKAAALFISIDYLCLCLWLYLFTLLYARYPDYLCFPDHCINIVFLREIFHINLYRWNVWSVMKIGLTLLLQIVSITKDIFHDAAKSSFEEIQLLRLNIYLTNIS